MQQRVPAQFLSNQTVRLISYQLATSVSSFNRAMFSGSQRLYCRAGCATMEPDASEPDFRKRGRDNIQITPSLAHENLEESPPYKAEGPNVS